MKIDSTVAIVVGGASGMGRAFSEALLQNGATMLVGDVLERDGKAMQTELGERYGLNRIHFRKCDVSVQEEVAALFTTAEQTWGSHPDIVVTVAGAYGEWDWKRLFDINLGGVINVTKCCLETMGKDKGGRGGCLVHLASIAGLRPESNCPLYVASKHAVVSYTRSWALEANFSKHGIRMNCLCPTVVDTKFLRENKVPHVENMTNKLSASQVAEALIKVVKNDDINGEAVRVTDALGVDFATFQDAPQQ